jgi:ketosteroid isomerase-like protein
MKTFFFSLITVLFCNVALAQTAEEQKLSTVVTNFHKAMVDADQSVLEKLTATDLSFGHSNGKIEDRTAFIASLSSGHVNFSSIETTDQTIKITGKTAVVRNILNGKLEMDGKPIEIKVGTLMLFTKSKGAWTLLARQGYKL